MKFHSFIQYFIIIGCSCLFFLGFIQIPLFPESFEGRSFWLTGIILIAKLAPVLPLVAVLVRWLLAKPLNRKFIMVIAILIGCIGIFLSFFSAAFSGVGGEIAGIHGLTLTLGVIAGVLFLSVERLNAFWLLIIISWIAPVYVAGWSLITVPEIIVQAKRIADDRPFCIAPHDSSPPIESLVQLRGLSFYSKASGYKNNSRWYFHGLLLVQTNNGLAAYNWSPRHLEFHKIERPRLQFVNPLNACQPKSDFFGSF